MGKSKTTDDLESLRLQTKSKTTDDLAINDACRVMTKSYAEGRQYTKDTFDKWSGLFKKYITLRYTNRGIAQRKGHKLKTLKDYFSDMAINVPDWLDRYSADHYAQLLHPETINETEYKAGTKFPI